MGGGIYDSCIYWRDIVDVGGYGMGFILPIAVVLTIILLTKQEGLNGGENIEQEESAPVIQAMTSFGKKMAIFIVIYIFTTIILACFTSAIPLSWFDELISYMGISCFIMPPLAFHVYVGVFHFRTRRLYKSNQLSDKDRRSHIVSGITFYVCTALLIWVVWFSVGVFTGEIHLM